MNLVDIAKYVIKTEPPEDSSIVHMLGNSLAFWHEKDTYVINLIEKDQDVTSILSLDLHEDGTALGGCLHLITAAEETIDYNHTLKERLPALVNYIMSYCLERIPHKDIN